jgi:hypothetical protein
MRRAILALIALALLDFGGAPGVAPKAANTQNASIATIGIDMFSAHRKSA